MVNPAEMAGRRPGEKPSSVFALTCSRLSQYLKEKGGLGDLGLGISATAAPVPTVETRGRPEPLRTMNLLPGVEFADEPAVNGDAASDGNNESDPLTNLFPRRAGFGTSDEGKPDLIREPQKAQMTIFYGGKVVVLDNFPADKAREMMIMAGRSCPAPAQRSRAEQPATAPQRPGSHSLPQHTSAAALASSSEAKSAAQNPPTVISQVSPQKPPQPAASDLPIARSVSLHRFLEKRKDRISARAPYPTHVPSPMASSSASPAKPEEKRRWLGLAPHVCRPERAQNDSEIFGCRSSRSGDSD